MSDIHTSEPYGRIARDRIFADIERNGRHIIGVVACLGTDDQDLPFAYTIGNAYGLYLPELLVIGPRSAFPILNELSEMMIERDAAFTDGELVSLGGRFPVRVITASQEARENYTVQAGVFYGHDNYSLMQVVLPDGEGRFPGDPRCAAPWRDVPLLGEVRH
jgi:Domain of unknown function (DUF4262)